eukprot:3937081-Rhodomonas_salina.1
MINENAQHLVGVAAGELEAFDAEVAHVLGAVADDALAVLDLARRRVRRAHAHHAVLLPAPECPDRAP